MQKLDGRGCRECGGSMARCKAEAVFCTPDCRMTFNNRRAMRGADLYDAFMALRYDRKRAYALGLWTLICRMAQAWRAEDAGRDRPTWSNPQAIVERHVKHTAVRNRTR